MFQRSVVFIAVLTLSMPFITLAQQHPEQTEVSEAGATQAASTMRLEVKAAARQDAGNDFQGDSKFRWFSSAIASPVLGMCIGCGVGYAADPLRDDGYGDWNSDCSGGTKIIPGLFIGLAVGVVFPFVASVSHSPNIPAERLLGKSPEYVKSYSDAYKSRIRLLRLKWIAAGTATGFGLSAIGYLAIRPSGL